MSECLGKNHYFALFGVPVSFIIDKNTLKKNLLILQKTHHPDQQHTNTNTQSALINHAYHTLIADDLRAVYLLELAGQTINLDNSIKDLDFLDEMMDIRTALEDAKLAQDMSAIAHLRHDLEVRTRHQGERFDAAYEQKHWLNAIDSALKLKFLAKLYEDILTPITPHEDNDDDLYV